MPKGIPKSGFNPSCFPKGYQSMLGKKPPRPFKKGNTLGKNNKGRKRPDLSERNRLNRREHISYKGIHMWIRNNYGKAIKCEHCGEKDKMIHWANKDHTYSRDIKDWVQLCVSCHRNYDKLKNIMGGI